MAKIFANAEHYNISLKKQNHKPAFVAVNIGSQLDLSKAAQLSAISLKELFTLNPGFNRGYTPPQGPHRLLIPIDNAELFKKNLAKLPFDERVQWQRHKVKAGESLSTIAYRYKTKTKAIRDVNHLTNNTIRAGKYLLIPTARSHVGKNPFTQANVLNPSNKYPTYKVTSGDSVWLIARRLGLHSKDIARWNRIGLNTPLRLGQTLVIKQNNKTTQQLASNPDTMQSIRYTVRNGDSLFAISEKFNVRITDLRRWNASKLGKYLKPGQTLTVKVDTTQPST